VTETPMLSVSSQTRAFLGESHGLLIDGEHVPAADGRTFATFDPATARPLAEVADAGTADVDAAVQAAIRAGEPGAEWRRWRPRDRGRAIARLAALVEERADTFAELESLDNGKPLKFARGVDVAMAVDHLDYYAGWPTKIEGATLPVSTAGTVAWTRKEPVGVCGQIVPWNFPLLMAAWKVAPALAAGCTIVLKPAEQTPLTALLLGACALEAGIPPGVLNVVTGGPATGAAIVDHPGVDKVAFTGSTEVGRGIGAKAGAMLKRVTLELGGKSPNIVLADADVGAAVKGAFTGMYFNSGQACNAASRLLVQAPIFDDVVCALASQARATTPGPGLDPKTFVGPLVSAAQLERVAGYVARGRAEAELVAGGGHAGPGGGYFADPTLFVTEDDDAAIVREEIFGPVLVAQRFDDLEEVARRANAGAYGLAAGVWTSDAGAAQRLSELLRAGTVYLNCWGLMDPAAPFGGVKASGVGRESGGAGLAAYLEDKTVFSAVPRG
jgi:acyl-CoA reductase-like NAD-dependent aldehyde dehydrogenase